MSKIQPLTKILSSSTNVRPLEQTLIVKCETCSQFVRYHKNQVLFQCPTCSSYQIVSSECPSKVVVDNDQKNNNNNDIGNKKRKVSSPSQKKERVSYRTFSPTN